MCAKNVKNNSFSGLPWWRRGWESACQCRGRGFEPWSGKIPHAAGQLDPWATTTEPACLEPVLRSKRGRDSERPVHRNEEWPPLATTRESPRTETKTNIAINQSINQFKKKKNSFSNLATQKPIQHSSCSNHSTSPNFPSLVNSGFHL